MAYSQPPQYNFGEPSDNQGQSGQQPSSVPPYSPTQPGYQPQGAPYPTAPTVAAGPPLPSQGPQKSPAVPILAIASTLCFVGAVLFLILWMQAGGDRDEAQELADNRASDVSQLEEDLESAQTELEASQSQVSELSGQVEELEGQIEDAAGMQACVDALDAFYDTEPESDEETAALEVMAIDCADWIY